MWRGRASALRLGFRAGRTGAAAAAIGHELIELGLVLGVAQALQEFPELALLLFEPAQRLGAIFVERPISARPGVAAAVPAARGLRESRCHPDHRKTFGLRPTQGQVHRLHGRTAGALDEVVDRAQRHQHAGVDVDGHGDLRGVAADDGDG